MTSIDGHVVTNQPREEAHEEASASRYRHRRPGRARRHADAQDKKTLAFVVNGASDFWKLAEAGVKKAQASCRTTTCSSNIPSRPRPRCSSALMDDLVAAGADAIMVSRRRSEDLDRRAQPHRRPGAAVHHRQRRAGHQPHRLYRLVQHRRRQAGRRDRASRRCPTAASAWASSACSAPTTRASASTA